MAAPSLDGLQDLQELPSSVQEPTATQPQPIHQQDGSHPDRQASNGQEADAEDSDEPSPSPTSLDLDEEDDDDDYDSDDSQQYAGKKRKRQQPGERQSTRVLAKQILKDEQTAREQKARLRRPQRGSQRPSKRSATSEDSDHESLSSEGEDQPEVLLERHVSEEQAQADILELRNMAELCESCDFLFCFRAFLGINTAFSFHSLVDALVRSPGPGMLAQLHTELLRGIVSTSFLSEQTCYHYLSQRLQHEWGTLSLSQGLPPFSAPKQMEAQAYAALPARDRARALLTLCDVRAEREDIRNAAEEVARAVGGGPKSKAATALASAVTAAATAKGGSRTRGAVVAAEGEPPLISPQQLRRECLGVDAAGATYWWLDWVDSGVEGGWDLGSILAREGPAAPPMAASLLLADQQPLIPSPDKPVSAAPASPQAASLPAPVVGGVSTNQIDTPTDAAPGAAGPAEAPGSQGAGHTANGTPNAKPKGKQKGRAGKKGAAGQGDATGQEGGAGGEGDKADTRRSRRSTTITATAISIAPKPARPKPAPPVVAAAKGGGKGSKKAKVSKQAYQLPPELVTGAWQVVASNLEELEAFGAKLGRSLKAADKQVADQINGLLVPALQARVEEAEKWRRARQRTAKQLGLGLSLTLERGTRQRKAVNYCDVEYDKQMKSAIRDSKTGRDEPRSGRQQASSGADTGGSDRKRGHARTSSMGDLVSLDTSGPRRVSRPSTKAAGSDATPATDGEGDAEILPDVEPQVSSIHHGGMPVKPDSTAQREGEAQVVGKDTDPIQTHSVTADVPMQSAQELGGQVANGIVQD